MINFGRLWWSNGVYLQVTDLNHTDTVNDPYVYSHVWVRTVVGLSF
jgi:hypothetical protein